MNFEITNYQKIDYKIYTRQIITLKSDTCVDKVYCGVDPGSAKMGMTVYAGNTLWLSQINFKPEKDPIAKILRVCEVVRNCVLPYTKNLGVAVTEGASYGSPFGQVNLAEARSAAMLTLCQLGFVVKKIPPKEIRKLSLGEGNNKGECFEMPMDAVASFLACLVAMQAP